MLNDDLRRKARAGRRRPLWSAGEAGSRLEMGKADVERLLPHREPFLFVDGLVALDRENGVIRGHYTIPPSDNSWLAGHFPGNPIFPGVLLLEVLGQIGLCLLALQQGRDNRSWEVPEAPLDTRVLKVHHALFAHEARPGSRLDGQARLIATDTLTATVEGQLWEGERLVLYAIMEVYFVDE